MKQEIEMSAWSFETLAVEGKKVVVLKGYIRNHPKLGNVNDIVTTSAILYFDARTMRVETMNTSYKLIL